MKAFDNRIIKGDLSSTADDKLTSVLVTPLLPPPSKNMMGRLWTGRLTAVQQAREKALLLNRGAFSLNPAATKTVSIEKKTQDPGRPSTASKPTGQDLRRSQRDT
jgi:hypothetical protein